MHASEGVREGPPPPRCRSTGGGSAGCSWSEIPRIRAPPSLMMKPSGSVVLGTTTTWSSASVYDTTPASDAVNVSFKGWTQPTRNGEGGRAGNVGHAAVCRICRGEGQLCPRLPSGQDRPSEPCSRRAPRTRTGTGSRRYCPRHCSGFRSPASDPWSRLTVEPPGDRGERQRPGRALHDRHIERARRRGRRRRRIALDRDDGARPKRKRAGRRCVLSRRRSPHRERTSHRLASAPMRRSRVPSHRSRRRCATHRAALPASV